MFFVVWLRIPKPTPNPQIFQESACHQKLGCFAAVSDGFGSSVREMIFTYGMAVLKLAGETVSGSKYDMQLSLQCGELAILYVLSSIYTVLILI